MKRARKLCPATALLIVAACMMTHENNQTTTGADHGGDTGGNQPVLFPSRQQGASKDPVKAATSNYKNIREIDFRNFRYEWYPEWLEKVGNERAITLTDGVFIDLKAEPRFEGRFGHVSYGNLDRNDGDEAVVVLELSTSGSRNRVVFVYALDEGVPRRIWEFEAGVKADGGLFKVWVGGNHLKLLQYKPVVIEGNGRTTILASSRYYTRSVYRMKGEKFVKVKVDEIPCYASDTSPWVVH